MNLIVITRRNTMFDFNDSKADEKIREALNDANNKGALGVDRKSVV